MTRGERAAIEYVRALVPARVLASLQQLGNEAYRRVLAACRADLGLPPDRGDTPCQNVLAAVPEEHRAALERPLNDLMDAEFDRRRVAERASCLIGLVTGQGRWSRSARWRKGGAPHAAQRFVGLVLRATFDDALDLIDPYDPDREASGRAQRAAYAKIETAVRRRFRATHDLETLELAVRLAVPEEQRDDVATAVSKLMDAVTDELTVKQQAAYVVGLSVGRALQASASGELGGGWRAPRP